MKRREFVTRSLAGAAVAAFAAGAVARSAQLPKRDRIKVAFLLGEGANVIDTAGP